jgi:hypothetical protein
MSVGVLKAAADGSANERGLGHAKLEGRGFKGFGNLRRQSDGH